MIGRLKPGISPAQAQSDANRVAQEIMRGYPAEMASLPSTLSCARYRATPCSSRVLSSALCSLLWRWSS